MTHALPGSSPLSPDDYQRVPTDGPKQKPVEPSSSSPVAVDRMKQSPAWACGDRRLQLRQAFNMKEMEAAKLIQKYDRDGNKLLEGEELELLLQDYNGGRRPKPDEVSYITKVADLDYDGSISQAEILSGLSAWHAFNHMPRAVGAAMQKYKVGYGPLPSVDALRDFLEVLNESQPVPKEEAEYVRAVALSVGASESTATIEQMRKAVAAWYINIERGESSKEQLAYSTVSNMQERINDFTILKGELDFHAPHTQIIAGVVALIFIVIPGLNLVIAQTFPSDYQCEHPHLSNLLWWTSLVTLILAVFLVFAGFTFHDKCADWLNAKMVFRAAAAGALAVGLLLELFGYIHVASCSAGRCGFMLWNACQFTFFVQPMLIGLLACCGVPVLYAQEYYNNSMVDQELHVQA